MTTQKKDTRSPENVVTSFSISRKLLREAKLLAAMESRPLSNLIQVLLENALDERRKK